jgi:hypothetical protein
VTEKNKIMLNRREKTSVIMAYGTINEEEVLRNRADQKMRALYKSCDLVLHMKSRRQEWLQE